MDGSFYEKAILRGNIMSGIDYRYCEPRYRYFEISALSRVLYMPRMNDPVKLIVQVPHGN
jgi:hypothetical protein